MKRLLAILSIAIIFAGILFAKADNLQRIFGTSCDEYQAIKYLYISQGHSLPSTTGPWSADELMKMLGILDYQALNQVEKNTYDTVLSNLTKDARIEREDAAFNFNSTLNLELYLHTNADGYARTTVQGVEEKAFQGVDQWIYSAKDQKSFYNIEWESFIYQSIYTNFQMDLGNSWHAGDDYERELGYENLNTNILFLRSLVPELALFDANFPHKAFASVGGNGWNLQIGRDRLSWGAGEEGNLTISDNMPWQDFFRATTYTKHFKYTFLTSFYTHPINYWDNQYEGSDTGTWHGQHQDYPALHGLRMYIAHRFEGRFLNDRLTVTGTEGLMYMSEDNTIDFRALNPMNFNHNNYIANNSNSTLAFEFDYTPIKGLNLFGQVIIDEIAFPGIEDNPSPTESSTPPASGFMLGAKSAFTVGDGLFHITGEFAKTSPYLYLRDGIYENSHGVDDGMYGIDYVVALRDWSSSVGDITYNNYFLGYTYGCDALVGNLKAGWTRSDLKLSVEGSLLFMAHGTHDAWTQWDWYGGSQESYDVNHTSPTPSHTTNNNKYPNAKVVRNSIQYTTVCGINANYAVTRYLDAMVQADYVNIVNYGNESGINQDDFQTVVSLTLKF